MNTRLVQRIHTVLQEMQAIREELSIPAKDPETGELTPQVRHETVQALQTAVDQTRIFLWAYVDSWAIGGATPVKRIQRIRMQHVAEMLQKLHEDFHGTGLPPISETERLRAQVRAIMPLLPD